MPALSDVKSLKLPTLPRAALKILDLVRDPDVELQDLGKAIEQDPALAVRLLRLSNSTFFGLCRQVTSIRQALMVLGLRQVKMAALSFSLADALPNTCNSRLMAECWRRILTNALGCRIAAPAFRLEPEEAFLAGMMQDVAMIVFAAERGDQYARILKLNQTDSSFGLLELEREAFGMNHAELGEQLLREWNLPEGLLRAVGSHHQIDLKSILAARQFDLPTLMATTECITDFLLNPSESCFEMFNLVAESHGEAGSEIDKYLQMLELQVDEMAELLDLDLPPGNSAETILQRARQIAASLEDTDAIAGDSMPRAADTQQDVFGPEALPLRLRQELSQANRQQWSLLVILMRLRAVAPLERNGRIEESLELVQTYSNHLCKQARTSDSVFQFSRDTMCILAPNAAADNTPVILARLKLAGATSNAVAFGVVAVSYCPDRLADGESVLKQAVVNLAKAESTGQPCISHV